MMNIYKIYYIPVYMTNLQYLDFLKKSSFSGGKHHLATNLFFVGMLHSSFYKNLSIPPDCKVTFTTKLQSTKANRVAGKLSADN